jgi:hypothetical protein
VWWWWWWVGGGWGWGWGLSVWQGPEGRGRATGGLPAQRWAHKLPCEHRAAAADCVASQGQPQAAAHRGVDGGAGGEYGQLRGGGGGRAAGAAQPAAAQRGGTAARPASPAAAGGSPARSAARAACTPWRSGLPPPPHHKSAPGARRNAPRVGCRSPATTAKHSGWKGRGGATVSGAGTAGRDAGRLCARLGARVPSPASQALRLRSQPPDQTATPTAPPQPPARPTFAVAPSCSCMDGRGAGCRRRQAVHLCATS